jgi:hypothetical protein
MIIKRKRETGSVRPGVGLNGPLWLSYQLATDLEVGAIAVAI